MFLLYILLSVLCIVSSSHGSPLSITPCKPDDTNCMIAGTKTFYKKLVIGDKSIGADPVEPIFLEEIDGSQTLLKYKMTDTTISGFNKCNIKHFNHDKSQTRFVVKISCPHLDISGDYEMDGRLMVLPVKGKGKFSLKIDFYDMTVTATYKIIKGDNGKEHITIKSYHVESEPKKGVKFDFQNLFNGNHDLANSVQKFANENWKDVSVQFQSPIISTAVKKLVKTANKYLKTMPMDKVFL